MGITEKNVRHFAETLLGGRSYRSEDHLECEALVASWINWEADRDAYGSDWDMFYEVIVDYFGFTGHVFRGLQLVDGERLFESMYASFSTDEEVARMFAGYSTIHGSNNLVEGDHVVVKSYVERAFDIVRLLSCLEPVTDNDEIYEHIEHGKWECELVAPFLFEDVVEVIELDIPEHVLRSVKGKW